VLACASALDKGWDDPTRRFFDDVDAVRPYDQMKARLIAAEHLLAVGRSDEARRWAEPLRHQRTTENWYVSFRERLEYSP
jgi:hypothetical protein